MQAVCIMSILTLILKMSTLYDKTLCKIDNFIFFKWLLLECSMLIKFPLTLLLMYMYIPLDYEGDVLKDNLQKKLDYCLLPKAAWEKFIFWYGLTSGSKPICRLHTLLVHINKSISYNYTYLTCIHRYVVEYGKRLDVEIYLLNLKLCLHPFTNEIHCHLFSIADTIS